MHETLMWMASHPPLPRARQGRTTADARQARRIVLDTNVSLDLVVFRDPRWTRLRESIEQGGCDALMRTDCRAEFARVLGYPQFGLDPEQQVRAMQAFDALHRFPEPGECRPGPLPDLPQCRDPDDQKFIEFAYLACADVLISKDKAVLKLARRHRRAGLYEILSPQAWLARSG